jgi:glutaredoxin
MDVLKIRLRKCKDFLWENKFNTVVAVVIFFIILFQTLFTPNAFNIDNDLSDDFKNDIVQIFTQQTCSHCHKLLKFIEENDLSKYNIKIFDLKSSRNRDLLSQNIILHKIDVKNGFGTPVIFYGNSYMVGFEDDEVGIKRFMDFLENKNAEALANDNLQKTIKIPFLKEINLADLSLPMLTIIIGLADGFNPCAMWVLVYLLSITVALKDKKKIWLLLGSFLISSGILYFLFLTAWLNVFLFVGYLRILNLIIGGFALYFGITTVHEYIKNRGEVVCKLQDNETRKKSMSKIQRLVQADISLATIFGIIFLAFVVNSVEFACSAVLPATYTYMLAKIDLSNLQYYLYIFLYTIMYMLDDMIVFSCAAFTLNNYTGVKYEKYSTIIGGVLILVIGIFIVFFPSLLK